VQLQNFQHQHQIVVQLIKQQLKQPLLQAEMEEDNNGNRRTFK
jgi:hypothetical protein